MISHSRRIAGLAAAFVLIAGSAQAQGKGHGKGHDKYDKHDNRGEQEMRDDRYEQGRRVPPGLAKKPGGMPPGQYKKHYAPAEGAGVLRDVFVRRGYTVVRTDNAGTSQYVYYRLRDGSVRRAVVTPGTDRLGFSNVPSALLREVLARLY